MPTTSRNVTSKFGRRWGRNHEGIDIKVYIGDTICSAFDGKVRVVDYNGGGYGYYVIIRHPNGLETLYGHMSRQLVKPNQIVRAGQPIGLGGNTGRSSGSHLHFETRICSTPVDPALMFDFANQDITNDYFITRRAYGERQSAVAANALQMQIEKNKAAALAEREAEAEEAEESAATRKVTLASAPATTKATRHSRRKAAAPKSYTVKTGDNLTQIARENGTTVAALKKKNGIKGNTIRKGQKIKL